jgi:hypothetical protein
MRDGGACGCRRLVCESRRLRLPQQNRSVLPHLSNDCSIGCSDSPFVDRRTVFGGQASRLDDVFYAVRYPGQASATGVPLRRQRRADAPDVPGRAGVVSSISERASWRALRGLGAAGRGGWCRPPVRQNCSISCRERGSHMKNANCEFVSESRWNGPLGGAVEGLAILAISNPQAWSVRSKRRSPHHLSVRLR